MCDPTSTFLKYTFQTIWDRDMVNSGPVWLHLHKCCLKQYFRRIFTGKFWNGTYFS